MRIITLVENLSLSPEYKHKHGLSFYVETAKHKLLFDLGSNGLFLENAEKLNVDIGAVDTVIISHGHKDHGGALHLFLKKNKTAKVYVRKTAFDSYYTKVLGLLINVGLNSSLKNNKQVVLTDDKFIIDDELMLFSGVIERNGYSLSNNYLFMKTDTGIQHDDFLHEQNLIISENAKLTLIAGCAHNGILNILNKAKQITGVEIDFVISGLHLYNPITKKGESEALIKEIAIRLKASNARYYTCHCTGQKAFDILKGVLADKLCYLSTGSLLNL